MKNSLISIIVPNYNNEQYLSDCLDSILEQTYKNTEIIIIDDHSNDNSCCIIDKYASKHRNIEAVFNNTNLGISKNRNVGIKLSKGDYVTTLDSDDIFIEQSKLASEMEIILNNNEEIISFSNIVLINQAGERSPKQPNKTIRSGNIFQDILLRSCMIPRDFIVSKKALYKVGLYDENIIIYEDWDIKLRLSMVFNFIYTGIDGTGYRQHGGGLHKRDPKEHQYWMNYIFNKNFPKIRSNRIELWFKYNIMIFKIFYWRKLKNKIKRDLF